MGTIKLNYDVDEYGRTADTVIASDNKWFYLFDRWGHPIIKDKEPFGFVGRKKDDRSV